jgi:TonB-linked SusC/RagA family outer membrane protein
MKNLLITFCCSIMLVACCYGQQPVSVSGTVVNASGAPLAGASVVLLGTTIGTQTDSAGHFSLAIPRLSGMLRITFLGYRPVEISPGDGPGMKMIRLERDNEITEVTVSSGYQQQDKRLTTGSYGVVPKELLDHSVSTDIIPRLDGIAPSLAFDNRAPDQQNLSIRGHSTILSDNSPLIVLDNFPYNGDLHDINPNDVESITILRDAASAAIWGARAGNGVIVVTTKHGRYNSAPHVSLNASWTVGEKPDLFYSPEFLSSADFISVEEQLFAQGFYSANAASPDKPLLSPVVDLLTQAQNGQLSQADADAQINALKGQDVRRDFERYFYRKSLAQQYSLSLDGGGDKYNYLVSGGFDDNRSNLVGNSDNRYTVHAVNNFSLLKNLQVGADISYTSTRAVTNNPGYTGINSGDGTVGLYPYAGLADAQGNPLPVAKDHPLSFSENAQSQGFLDWQYRPLQELQLADNVTSAKDTRLKLDANYTFLPGFSAGVLYEYEHSQQTGNYVYSQDTYFARDLVNQYEQPGGIYEVPLGGILNTSLASLDDQSGRFQLNYSHLFGGVHRLTAVAGAEVRNSRTQSSLSRLYGYDPDILVNQPVDYIDYFSLNPGGDNYGSVPYVASQADRTDRYVSEYVNTNYNYQERYYLSASARKDASNLFGVNANQRGVPLFSAGAGWQASNESFYHLAWLPYLKLRATFGYTGNVNKSVTAYTTALYMTDIYTGLPDALIYTPPNPDLQWERVRTINLGADFETRDKRISGSIDWFWKKGSDQLGSVALDPTTGFFVSNRYSYELNSSGFAGQGADIELNTRNTIGKVQWQTRLLFSYARDKVTQYQYQNPVSSYLAPDAPPLQGRPLQGIYSYKWAGLDPQTGDPMVYLKGMPSKDYAAIAATATVSDLVYNGPALPPVFGSVMNTLTFRQFSLSANVTYKFGYYFHRPSINYTSLINNWQGNTDFDKRWQQPGDEKFTSVPSLSLSDDANRDNAYINSSVLVDKGDNIRLHDVQLSYTLSPRQVKHLSFRSLSLYAYATNLGILWRANKDGIDPDYIYGTSVLKPARTYALGVRANF